RPPGRACALRRAARPLPPVASRPDGRHGGAHLRQHAARPVGGLRLRLTSGEMRMSNFLLWQSAYAEFEFTTTLWPDFGGPDLEAALRAYAGRQRRFG